MPRIRLEVLTGGRDVKGSGKRICGRKEGERGKRVAITSLIVFVVDDDDEVAWAAVAAVASSCSFQSK